MKQSELRQLIRENIKQIYEVEYYRDKAALDTLLWLNRNAQHNWGDESWEGLGKDNHLGSKLTIDKDNTSYDNEYASAEADIRDNWDKKYWQLIKSKGGKVQATIKDSDIDLIGGFLRNNSSGNDFLLEPRGTWTIIATGGGDDKKLEIISPRYLTWAEVGDDTSDKNLRYDPILSDPSKLPSGYNKEPIDYDSLYNK